MEGDTTLRLLDKLRAAGTPLGKFIKRRIHIGIKTGLNKAFVVDRSTRDQLIAAHPSSAKIIKPYIRGRDIHTWIVQPAKDYLIRIESSENVKHPWSNQSIVEAETIFAETYPAIYNRFNEHRNDLIKRTDQGKYFWELRSCAYWQAFEETKIVYPDISPHGRFALDTGSCLDMTAFCTIVGDLFLLGVLNSSVVQFYFPQICPRIRGGFLRYKTIYVEQIPIPAATPEQQAPIIALVERILAAKRADAQADVRAWEAEIDTLVYALYGLNADEIAVVEGR